MALDFFVVISSLIMGDELETKVAVSVKSASVEAVLKNQFKKISKVLTWGKTQLYSDKYMLEYLGKFSLLLFIL